MYPWKIVIFCLCVTWFSCKSSKQTKRADSPNTIDMLMKGLGENYQTSISGDLTLFFSSPDLSGGQEIRYLVVNNISGAVIVPVSTVRGEVSWHTENILLIKNYLGVIKDPNTLSIQYELLDCTTLKKTHISSLPIQN